MDAINKTPSEYRHLSCLTPGEYEAGFPSLIPNESCGILSAMTAAVEKLASEVQSLRENELDEFLSWLADYELAHSDPWDTELERDSQPGGRLDAVLKRVRSDIAAGS